MSLTIQGTLAIERWNRRRSITLQAMCIVLYTYNCNTRRNVSEPKLTGRMN